MYDKLEELKDLISNTEMDDNTREIMLDLIIDIEREMDIQDGMYSYLNDEDNFE